MLREATRRFVDAEIAPIAAKIDEDNLFPHPLWQSMGEMGLLGMTIPEQYGGSDLGYLAHVVAMEEISRGSGSIGLSYGAHSNLCLNNLYHNGNEEQRQRFVPKLVTGEYVGALAMSEPGAGSDVVGSMSCRAEKHGDRWIANGSKMWITNGPEADVALVYMRTAPADAGSRAMTAFIVEKGMKGYTTAQKLDKLGMRGSNTCELVFEDCEIPDENRLGDIDRGVYLLMNGLDSERLVLSGGPIGIMQAAMDTVIPYVQERKQFGRAIGSFQAVKHLCADMLVGLESARSAAGYATWALATGSEELTVAAPLAKSYASEAFFKAAGDSIQIHGGIGFTWEHDAHLYFKRAKSTELLFGSPAQQRAVLADRIGL